MTKKEAGAAIGQLQAEWAGSKATEKQARVLERAGLEATSKAQAGVLIDLLKARRWRRPDYWLTPERFRIRPRGGKFFPVVKDSDCGDIVLPRPFVTAEACREFIKSVLDVEGKEVPA